MIKDGIFSNLGLKLLALFLAIATWFYIVVELEKGATAEKEAIENMLPFRIVTRQLPIKLNLTGELSDGYVIVQDQIKIEPSTCVMIGPKTLVNRMNSIETQPVDISGHTRTVSKNVAIAPPIKGIEIKEKFVKVTIPIAKSQQ